MKKRNSVKEQTKLSFQLGGTTPMLGTGVINTPANVPTTGFTPYVAPVIPGFTGPQLQNTQYTTATQTTNLPTFLQTVGTKPGEYDELRRYVNDAGQVKRIPFKNGQPIYPIPEGYRFEAEDTTQVTAPTTGPVTTVGQTQDDGGGDGFDGGTSVVGSVRGPDSKSTGLSGVKDAISNITGYFSGTPAEAQPYGGTTLSGVTNRGSITDLSNNISGVRDALGVYGTGPINMGIVANMLMGNPLGAMASASGIGPSSEMFGQEAPAGFGSFSTAQLNDYVSGKMSPIEMQATGISAMNKSQAVARAAVQDAIGTEITGVVGYNKGDISPITGTPVNQYGQVVNYKGSTTGVERGFSTMGDWIDAMKAGIKSGYYGGFKSKAEVALMNKEEKGKYAAYAKERGANVNGEGPATGPAAEAGIAGTPEGGYGPTGRQSSTGRQDYSGGISQATSSARDTSTGFGMDEGQQDNDPGATDGDPGTSGGSQGGGYGGGTDCLTEDMKVSLNGVIDFVTNIKVGDMIDNYKVKEVLHKHMRSGYYAINNELKISNDHPVLANGTWTRPEDLVVGDSINGIPVASLEYVERMTPTVSIVIDGESFDVHTENNIYTVHGRYREVRQEAA